MAAGRYSPPPTAARNVVAPPECAFLSIEKCPSPPTHTYILHTHCTLTYALHPCTHPRTHTGLQHQQLGRPEDDMGKDHLLGKSASGGCRYYPGSAGKVKANIWKWALRELLAAAQKMPGVCFCSFAHTIVTVIYSCWRSGKTNIKRDKCAPVSQQSGRAFRAPDYTGLYRYFLAWCVNVLLFISQGTFSCLRARYVEFAVHQNDKAHVGKNAKYFSQEVHKVRRQP